MPIATEILAGIDAIATLAKLIDKQVEIAKQAGELTPEQEAEIDAKRLQTFSRPHWVIVSP